MYRLMGFSFKASDGKHCQSTYHDTLMKGFCCRMPLFCMRRTGATIKTKLTRQDQIDALEITYI